VQRVTRATLTSTHRTVMPVHSPTKSDEPGEWAPDMKSSSRPLEGEVALQKQEAELAHLLPRDFFVIPRRKHLVDHLTFLRQIGFIGGKIERRSRDIGVPQKRHRRRKA
jgi:hypothetical protein